VWRRGRGWRGMGGDGGYAVEEVISGCMGGENLVVRK
jgi:hypothetical protein